ncbi:M14 family zinc carboxypeptidase [Winogradskyella sp. 3972H.M.0a.05]|uniref:M14 family metallopeptidase n=1 Tax=Winogradskyella sp. 3972H.M.0a.05 TaxID=2950277 RepID=UPI00339AEB85
MHTRFLSIVLFFISLISFAQLQSPSEFLGYDLGSQFSRHHQVIDYFKHAAKTNSAQVKLENYGETYERRPLTVAFVSSEENIKNLETIRENNLKNTGIIKGNASGKDIAIVWLSYNVHGNEASATEASMSTLYRLLTENQSWLENTVVIIDPCVNPDGRDRYANWFNETSSKPYDIDQQASEHNEPWPGGRPNHYLFDLNRDWAWASQIESASRLKVYNKWLPHIHVDFHEQGINEPYYFAPAAEPFHEVISDWQRDFQTQIGKNHAKYFDKEGWLYFTRERFDLLYPSYGDTYPTFMGAIGMTYEQAGHGRSGLGILNDEGIILTLKDRIAHHTTTGLSTVEISSKNAKSLNTEFKKFFDNSNLKYKSYVLQGNADRIETLKSLLDAHEISYESARNGSASGYNYSTMQQGSMNTTSNDLVVHSDQPKGKMVKVLFEPNTKLSDSLTYDITSWSLPYAYGLKAIASTKKVRGSAAKATSVSNSVDTSAIGYALEWNSLTDAKFLADLLKQGVKIRFTEKPFTQEGKEFDRGSLIITKGDNPKKQDLDAIIVAAANKFSRKIHPLYSGFATSGPDFGSPDIKLVNKQKVAILSGKYTSSLNYGALWHFFEQQLKYPVTSINSEHFGRVNLNKYNVLIMPNGSYSSILNESGLKKLKSWIAKGGKVIAFGNAISSFADKKGFNLKSIKEDRKQDTINKVPYANRERENVKKLITGAVFKTSLDNTHPLAFGYPDHYYTLKIGRRSYKQLGNNNYNVGYLDAKPVKVSGFVGEKAFKNLPNSLIFGEERVGSGSIIYFVDDVMFRSFWENGKLFLTNAIFFVNNNAFEL